MRLSWHTLAAALTDPRQKTPAERVAHTLLERRAMDAVQTRAGEDFELGTGQVMQVGKQRVALGPTGPILRAVGLGLVVMLVLTLVSH